MFTLRTDFPDEASLLNGGKTKKSIEEKNLYKIFAVSVRDSYGKQRELLHRRDILIFEVVTKTKRSN